MTRPPIRIQLSRRKGWKKPEGAVVVARPTKWGNPFDWRKVPAHFGPRAWVVLQYDYWVSGLEVFPNVPAPPLLCTIRKELRGRDLACWCPVISHGKYSPCHADVLLSIANDIPMDEVILENTRRATGETL